MNVEKTLHDLLDIFLKKLALVSSDESPKEWKLKFRRIIAVVFVASAGVLTGAPPAVAQDIAAGKALYKKTCRNCHGPTAKGMASYPKLVGHPAEYLVDKLKQYRSGRKIGPNTALMTPNAKGLSDDDIANISAFIVSISK
ncbi:MAG: cytochrome c [Burkholderiaceae bacterium]